MRSYFIFSEDFEMRGETFVTGTRQKHMYLYLNFDLMVHASPKALLHLSKKPTDVGLVAHIQYGWPVWPSQVFFGSTYSEALSNLKKALVEESTSYREPVPDQYDDWEIRTPLLMFGGDTKEECAADYARFKGMYSWDRTIRLVDDFIYVAQERENG